MSWTIQLATHKTKHFWRKFLLNSHFASSQYFFERDHIIGRKDWCPKQTANDITALQNRAPDTSMAQNGMKMCVFFCFMHSKLNCWWNDWFLTVNDKYCFTVCIALYTILQRQIQIAWCWTTNIIKGNWELIDLVYIYF